ncbi:diaminopimelate epimerase [Desulfosporosinus orientis DSM 765]|uniref:Diaminopimelate epimerase n=1 Tax=Desulfosporosinus orientis (strain ATCC 19365 / DSM 765 / NCIMB 8382 / VKM B-1628 / Singapore I) TaxID=768706 RepID=G7W691_DESOD|nr:diaminopimelate epimerase [Desulfosporosinus orientis]AET67753.1 diaminopimelate epimerase [Desulfosporosinus orientis DSM 765]
MDFSKYHALGNDYIVIDPNKTMFNLTKENIELVCHRNFGVGSDGILYGPIFEGNNIKLKILNPDGSEAEKSGNGIRIFSRYLLDQGYVDTTSFAIDTLGGQVHVTLLDPKGKLVKVDMGSVTFLSDSIPVAGKSREVVDEVLELDNRSVKITCVSIGNPHCVIAKNDISEELAKEYGPLIENHPMFPNRINLQLLKVIDRSNIQIEIWERGAGYTLASGSSSCAAASAAYKLGVVNSNLKVHMPGGSIDIDINPDGHVHMTGSVSSVYSGKFSEELWQNLMSR